MREAGAVVVALRLEKDLGLVLEAAEALAVDDAVDVPLEAGAQLALGLGPEPPGAAAREDAPGADEQLLSPFSVLSWAAQGPDLLRNDFRLHYP